MPTEKIHLNVGTIGHERHGKTTLTAAITTVLSKTGAAKALSYEQIDALSKATEDGISTNTVHVAYETQRRRYEHIDCPGNTDYIHNTISGITQLDGAILVVSAVEGPMPQTREHILLARQFGTSYIVVYLNQCEIADEEMVIFMEEEIRSLLNQYTNQGDSIKVVHGSAAMALQGDEGEYGAPSIHKLVDALDTVIPDPARNTNGSFYMPVGEIFTIPGRGTFLSGKIEAGVVKPGDEVEIVGIKETKKVNVAGIDQLGKQIGRAEAGDIAGILLSGITGEAVERGMVLSKPGLTKPYDTFNAAVYVLKREEGGRSSAFGKGYKPQFYLGAACIGGEVTKITNTESGAELGSAMPGTRMTLTVKLANKIALSEGLKFVMMEGGNITGTGVISGVNRG